MVTVGLGIFIITYFISHFGEVFVAAYGIATRIEQIFLLPTIGLSIAALSLVGQANGAGDMKRVHEILRLCLRYGLYIMTAGTVCIFFFAQPLMDFFTNDSAVINAGTFYLRIAAFLTWAYVIMFTNTSALQGMKRPMFALWLGLFRQIVAPVIIFTLFSKFFGVHGIWWGIAVITWSATLITIFYLRHVFAHLR
jgi:Na+-driven multidrug efflux pump